jgi:hypothetical protein
MAADHSGDAFVMHSDDARREIAVAPYHQY